MKKDSYKGNKKLFLKKVNLKNKKVVARVNCSKRVFIQSVEEKNLFKA